MDSTMFKHFEKWAQRPNTKAKEATAQTNTWTAFTKQFPNADKNQFVAQINIDENWNVSAEMFFKAEKGFLQSMFGSDRRYWSQKMKAALGLTGMAGFPYQLLPIKTEKGLPIPAVDFTKTVLSLKTLQPTHKHRHDPRHLLHDTIQRNLPTNKIQAQQCSRIKTVAWRAPHVILAPTAQLRCVLCNTGVWNFTRNL